MKKDILRYMYVIKNGKISQAKSLLDWAQFMSKKENTIIARDQMIGESCIVSTKFLGLAHGLHQPPLLFETIVLGGYQNGFVRRFSTYEESLQFHKHLVKMLKPMYNN